MLTAGLQNQYYTPHKTWMTAWNRNIAWPSWVVFLIGCEKACTYLLGTAATELQYLMTAFLGCINRSTWGLLFSRRGLMPADLWLRERGFHCDACHPWLKKHHLLWPAPSVQSNFWGKKVCRFDVSVEDGQCLQHFLVCLCCSVPIRDCLQGDAAERNFNLSKSQVYTAVIHILQLSVAHGFIVWTVPVKG